MATPGQSITTINPPYGPSAGGTTIVITGQYFSNTTVVQFGSVAASSFTVDSDTQITAVCPAQSSGNVSLGMAYIGPAIQARGNNTFTYTQGLPISNTMTQVSSAGASHTSISIWGVDAAGNVFSQYNGSTWTQVAGVLKQVSVAADGTVWGINAVGNVYSYRGSQANSWAQASGVLSQVAVGSANLVYGVNAAGVVYQYRGSQANSWAQVGTGMKQVSVASDGTLWGTNSAGLVYQYAGNSTWTQIPTNIVAGGPNIPLTQLTVVDVYLIWGLDAQGNIYEYVAPGAPWQKSRLPSAQVLSYNVDTSCVLIDSQGITQFFHGSNM